MIGFVGGDKLVILVILVLVFVLEFEKILVVDVNVDKNKDKEKDKDKVVDNGKFLGVFGKKFCMFFGMKKFGRFVL